MFNLLKEKIANLEKVVRDLRHELATANRREESLNETINSLRAQVEKSSTPNNIPTSVIGTDVHQTAKMYSYNKKRMTSHTLLFVSASRSTNVKFCMQRGA